MSSTPPPAANGAKAANAAANAAAAAAATGAKKGFLSGWWTALTHTHAPAVQQRMQSAVKQIQRQKFVMPVDVKVDFLRPTFQVMQESANAVWTQLPPPVQQAAPYVGVSVGSFLIAFAIQQRRLKHERQRSTQLGHQVEALSKEKNELLKRINALKVRAGSPRTEVEARMAAAVAEATNAAAAAADAAARAATACIIQRPPAAAAQ